MSAESRQDDLLSNFRTERSQQHWRWILLAVLVIVGSLYGYRRHKYPYGWSHSCDKLLYFALLNYADAHDGQFPSGEATPEACLSLLAGERYGADATLLSGKHIDSSVTEETLARGELLGPETCGWHYVPGLRRKSDQNVALFWDKIGLGHNGQRLDDGGHIVWYASGNRRHIKASEWDSFIEEQQELLQKARDTK